MDNNKLTISIARVKEVENTYSKDSFDGLRIRAALEREKSMAVSNLPWAFPLLPKVFQVVPKEGEEVIIFMNESNADNQASQRYYIGPIISQPQFFTECNGDNATTLLQSKKRNPIGKISNVDETRGSFPNKEDVAVIGRGKEDVILKYNKETNTSEVDLRAGIRGESNNDDNPDLIGNVIFNGTDPAYIQLKYKQGLATNLKNRANSIINIVANRVNIMSNKDNKIAHNLNDKNSLVAESKMDEIMNSLHPLPMGDELVTLLKLIIGAIMHHVHPWPGMEQCGDWYGFIEQLQKYDVDSILSEYVRIS